MSRAVSIAQLESMNHNLLDFEGRWLDSFGKPELYGSWLIWGDSGEGKTTFVLQLCKYLSQFGRVIYDSLEEGASASMKKASKRLKMREVSRRFVLLNAEPIDELIVRLDKHKSPNIVVIDSVQFSGLNYKEYKALRVMFPKKLFILISHADGKLPYGRLAKQIRFDAFVKIRVEGFKAFPKSRYGGNAPFVIWDQGAKEYWGDIN